MKRIDMQDASLSAQKFILRILNLWVSKQHGLIIKCITLENY